MVITYLTLHSSGSRDYHSHFMDEKTEARRGHFQSHSARVAELEFEPCYISQTGNILTHKNYIQTLKKGLRLRSLEKTATPTPLWSVKPEREAQARALPCEKGPDQLPAHVQGDDQDGEGVLGGSDGGLGQGVGVRC